MTVEMLKAKIHRATVKQAALDYVGSITVDEELLNAAGILEYEKVQIADVDNVSRFETYTISGEPGSGMICLNGAAARCVSVGDKIIIMAYAAYGEEEAKQHKPTVLFVDEKNKISRVTNYEKHGRLADMQRGTEQQYQSRGYLQIHQRGRKQNESCKNHCRSERAGESLEAGRLYGGAGSHDGLSA